MISVIYLDFDIWVLDLPDLSGIWILTFGFWI